MSRSNPFPLDTKRHSGAHILAAAVLSMFPEAQFGVGPTTDTGFYYDFLLPRTLIPEDLEILEQKMQEIIKADLPIEYSVMPIDDAIKLFTQMKQPLKVELLKDLKEHGTTSFQEIYGDEEEADFHPEIQEVSVYKIGDFVDLCRGPHVERTGQLDMRGIKLDKISGAYFRGDANRESLQRVYGLQFDDKKQLKQFLHFREEAKKRDHRKLGKDLNLFTFSEVVGKGLPLWKEKGATVRRLLERFVVDEEISRGYKHVYTPDIANIDLYKQSGHYPYYKDSMYSPIQIDDEEYMLRPMTCPHHFQLYLDTVHSYRELPMRIAELAKLYRYEQSGELSGLIRVRSFCLADSHIIAMPSQAHEEALKALELIQYISSVFGLQPGEHYRYRLSLGNRQDEKKYYKDDKAWDHAEQVLREVLQSQEVPFYEEADEAAFYGPKIDIQMKNVMGKEDTAFTVQYDFVMPKRFNLRYIDETNHEAEPVVIHRSSIGAIERVFAFLVEFFEGRFPFWLAPEQVRILPINDSEDLLHYVSSIEKILTDTVLMEPLKYNEIRYAIDSTGESLGKKIRKASTEKIPVMIIVGPRDQENHSVSIRTQDGEKTLPLAELQDFLMTC